MTTFRRYLKRSNQPIIAVQLDLETDGFTYEKWGATQRCRAGDWLVDNGGSVYTIDKESFMQTYHQVSPGRFVKFAPVWARRAETDGTIATKEGATNYTAGDYIVYNDEARKDGYAVGQESFESMYKLAPDDD